MNKLSANRSQRTQTKPSVLGTGLAGANRSVRHESSIVSNSSIMDRTATREELHDVNITACRFPTADANNYYIGSLNGVMYKNALHNRGN